MEITVRQVSTRREMADFLTLPWKIYAADPLWVPPLLPEKKKTMSPTRGTFFQRGTAVFFNAYVDGVPAGTICAAEDPPTNTTRGRNDCVFGFFESIEEYEVAEALFDAASAWAGSHGLASLFGPFNLDYENAYGVLISGRDRPPALMCGHSPVYYRSFFERYGFEKGRGDMLAFAADLDSANPQQQRLNRLGNMVRERSKITIRPLDIVNFEAEIDIIHGLLVESLAHLEGSVPWRRDALKSTLMPLKPIVDPELVLFAEVNGKTVGWFPGVPNLNESFIRMNGLRYPWNYFGLLRLKKAKPKCLSAKSLLVLPEHWNTGVAILLFDELAKRASARGYTWVDLSLTAEDNPQTPIIASRLGAVEYKRYRIYRKSIT